LNAVGCCVVQYDGARRLGTVMFRKAVRELPRNHNGNYVRLQHDMALHNLRSAIFELMRLEDERTPLQHRQRERCIEIT
jgi:hypothetical protein